MAALALVAFGCSSPHVLANSQSSAEAVAQTVLDAVHRRDRQALVRLSMTREEFERVVWPALPASRREVGMPSSYTWHDTATKSQAHLDRMLRRWGGRRLHLVRLEFGGATSHHHTYSISRKATLLVRDESGMEHSVRLFGSVLRQHGRSKVYSYIVD